MNLAGAGSYGIVARQRRPVLSSLPEACRAEACPCGRARAVATLIDQVELRELQPHAVVADSEVLVDRLDALLVSRARELLALALLDLLGATDEGEEALALLGANGGYREELDRVSQLVHRGVHRDGLIGDRLPRERARPQLHRTE